MTAAQKRYPLSTADGKSIPLDAVRPYSFLALGVTPGAGTAAKQLPAEVELFSVMATVDCYLRFYAVATVVGAMVTDTEVLDTLFIPAGLHIVVSPPIGKEFFSARALSAAGTLYMQFLESWTGLTLQSQITRR